jgi:hypothetical protein
MPSSCLPSLLQKALLGTLFSSRHFPTSPSSTNFCLSVIFILIPTSHHLLSPFLNQVNIHSLPLLIQLTLHLSGWLSTIAIQAYESVPDRSSSIDIGTSTTSFFADTASLGAAFLCCCCSGLERFSSRFHILNKRLVLCDGKDLLFVHVIIGLHRTHYFEARQDQETNMETSLDNRQALFK